MTGVYAPAMALDMFMPGSLLGPTRAAMTG